MARIPEHIYRQVSFSTYANQCEKCLSYLNKIFNRKYVTVLCTNTGICEKIGETTEIKV